MDAFDLNLDDVIEAAGAFDSTNRNDDRRVCACGHGMSRHKFNDKANKYICLPGRLVCPCYVPRAVINTPNTRYFMRKSHGAGKSHALSLGYATSKEALGDAFSDKVEWLIEPICDICKTPTPYYPVRISRTGKVLFDSIEDHEDEGVTAFLCVECRDPIAHG